MELLPPHPEPEPTAVHSVGDWEAPWPDPLCPRARSEPDPCECGFTGRWQVRKVYVWHEGTKRHPTGYKVQDGWDERCPQCGDVERFDTRMNFVGRLQRGPEARAGDVLRTAAIAAVAAVYEREGLSKAEASEQAVREVDRLTAEHLSRIGVAVLPA